MLKTLRVYFFYFIQFIKSRVEYRADFIADIIANILVSGSGLLFVHFLIDGETIQSLKGWSREEIFLIYGLSWLPIALFGFLAPNLYQFGDKYIIQGQFDRVLLRPLTTILQVLFETFNLESLTNFVVGLFVFVIAANSLNIELGVLDWTWLAVSSLSGAIILLSVFTILASASFHFEDKLGLSPPFFNLINFSRYPLPIFNKIIQFILSFLVPFAFVAFFPATHFLGRREFAVFCYSTPIMALVMALFASVVWNYGVRKYGSTGS